MAGFRIQELDESVTSSKIIKAIADERKCTSEKIKTGEVKMTPNGIRTI